MSNSHLALLLTLVSSLLFAQGKADDYPDAFAQIEATENVAPMFPFYVPHGAPNNITNVQTWGGDWQEAGKNGFVKARGNHFADDRGSLHFTGTNVCFSGCFPEHAQAEEIAADLARFGINLVRLHYVHHRFPPNRKYATPDSFIEPIQLEKFDYLFHQLKLRGIYVYMQLNIARKFGKASGFEDADQLPWYNNGIDNIEPRMIALQKKYVRDLLTHVNPYTKLAYREEPAIAMLELANENSLVRSWYKGDLDNLPPSYGKPFLKLWNDWLRKKYANTATLRRVWKCRLDPLGEEMIGDGQFPQSPANEQNYPDWGLQHDGTSQGEWAIVSSGDAPLAGKQMTRLTIRKIGKTPNMPQFFRRFGIEKGTQYNLKFKLRVSRSSAVSVRVSQDHNPWHTCGLRTTFNADGEWREYSYVFLANMSDPKVRLVFANFAEGVTVEIGDVSFRPGGQVGLGENETLEAGTVPLPKGSGPPRYHLAPILADMSDFLFDLEEDYFQQMFRFTKEEVRVSQAVTGTQLQYGFWYNMGRMDYCDIHSYWGHPAAPGGGSWTNPKMKRYWFLKNLPMVNQEPKRTTISRLAIKRIVNRPFTVSEYDHPYPNFYAAEGNPMVFAMGAFQNWDAIMHFAWTHSTDYHPQVMTGYFDMKANSTKLVHYPACYAMFTRGDVTRGPGKFRYTPALTEQQEREMQGAQTKVKGYRKTTDLLLQADPALAMAVFAGLELTDLPSVKRLEKGKKIASWDDLPETMGSPEKKWIRNEFSELYWNFDGAKGGYFMVDTPNTKIFTGFGRGRSFEYGGLKLELGKNRLDWATISLVKAKGETGKKEQLVAGHYLLAATGMMRNTGTVLKQVTADRVSTAEGYGGRPGTAPILCEGIAATLTMPLDKNRVKLFALDPTGKRGQEVPVDGTATQTRLQIGAQYRTIWYELIIE